MRVSMMCRVKYYITVYKIRQEAIDYEFVDHHNYANTGSDAVEVCR